MPTLAQELNNLNYECGITQGKTWFVNDQGDDTNKVGEYTIIETGTEHDTRIIVEPYFETSQEQYIICGYDSKKRAHLAIYTPNAPTGKQWRDHQPTNPTQKKTTTNAQKAHRMAIDQVRQILSESTKSPEDELRNLMDFTEAFSAELEGWEMRIQEIEIETETNNTDQ